jgi:hypothetical protein
MREKDKRLPEKINGLFSDDGKVWTSRLPEVLRGLTRRAEPLLFLASGPIA